VYVVLVTEIASDAESEAYATAKALGLSAYDVKMRITGLLPRVLVQTNDNAEATRAVAALRARKNGVVLLDTSKMPVSRDLVHVHRFSVDDHFLWANGPGERAPRLALTELAAVVVIAARTDITRTTVEREVHVRGGPQGGTTHEVEHTSHEHVVEQSAFLFGAPDAEGVLPAPWLLHEREVRYLGLGPKMQPTQRANFGATIALLRERAPHIVVDDRFVRTPLATTDFIAITGIGPANLSTAPRGVDVIVRALASHLLRSRGGPYR
jgi:hypothetical protein